MTRIFKDRIFNFAITISVFWHIFWISAINVVVSSKETNPVKFSGVSFLGPILERSIMEVKIRPPERSLLEKRYIQVIDRLNKGGSPNIRHRIELYTDTNIAKNNDLKLNDMVEEILAGSKIEPRYVIE